MDVGMKATDADPSYKGTRAVECSSSSARTSIRSGLTHHPRSYSQLSAVKCCTQAAWHGRPLTRTHGGDIAASHAAAVTPQTSHLEHSLPVAQHVTEQAVARGAARARRAQHRPVRQHQLHVQQCVYILEFPRICELYIMLCV